MATSYGNGTSNTAAVQILITINGKSLTASNNKRNVVSLKVSRVIGDAADSFTLELFDETAWKIESALYNTDGAPITIIYGATDDWANGKHITFTGFITNYSLSFVRSSYFIKYRRSSAGYRRYRWNGYYWLLV